MGHEADHSLPPNTKVKNAWSYTFTPPTCLHGVVLNSRYIHLHGVVDKHRDYFIFYRQAVD
jgi:hypothetical protein